MSRVQGARKVKRLLKAIEQAMRLEVMGAMEAGGRELLAKMKAEAPSSRVKAALTIKVLPKTLRVRVGLIGKATNRRLFFARILEFGRGIKKTTDRIGRRIGAINAAHYVYGPRTDVRKAMRARVRDTYSRALARASQGAGGND